MSIPKRLKSGTTKWNLCIFLSSIMNTRRKSVALQIPDFSKGSKAKDKDEVSIWTIVSTGNAEGLRQFMIMNSLWWSGVKIDHRHRHGATKADPRRGGGRHRGGVRGGGRTPGPPDHFVWSTGTYTCTLYLLLHLYVPVWNRRAATGFYGFIILIYSDKGYVINCFAVIIFASTMFSTSNCRNSLFAN